MEVERVREALHELWWVRGVSRRPVARRVGEGGRTSSSVSKRTWFASVAASVGSALCTGGSIEQVIGTGQEVEVLRMSLLARSLSPTGVVGSGLHRRGPQVGCGTTCKIYESQNCSERLQRRAGRSGRVVRPCLQHLELRPTPIGSNQRAQLFKRERLSGKRSPRATPRSSSVSPPDLAPRSFASAHSPVHFNLGWTHPRRRCQYRCPNLR